MSIVDDYALKENMSAAVRGARHQQSWYTRGICDPGTGNLEAFNRMSDLFEISCSLYESNDHVYKMLENQEID